MKIIFEYEDGTYRVIPNIKLSKLEEKTPETKDLDITICDYDVVNMYIVADNNVLGGFKGERSTTPEEDLSKRLERDLDPTQLWIKKNIIDTKRV